MVFYSKSLISLLKCKFIVFIISLTLFSPNLVSAEISEFGGYPARFKGKGDLEPPLCNVEYPKVANEPFFISWNCMDNESSPDELQAEVWILRKSSNVPRKIGDFLGFPASIHINKSNVTPYESFETEDARQEAQMQEFSSFLPIGIRLVVRDRSGTASLSPVLTIEAGSGESSLGCTISIESEPVPADSETSGTPALFAVASNITASSSANISGSQTLRSVENFQFSPCELSELCNASSNYSFQYSEQNSSQGNLGIIPLDSPNDRINVMLTSSSNQTENSVSMSGNTIIDGVNSTVRLDCQ